MSARLVNIDRDTPMLLPPDLRDWLPEDHLVHFVLEVVETMDMGEFKVNERGTGNRQYPPSMMLSLLAYCYATGRFSSRMIERASWEDVAVRYLCAGEHPDHETKLPDEIARRKQRMVRIREAVDVIEEREKAKVEQERKRREANVEERRRRRERGEKVGGREPKEVEDKVDPKAQYNFTDPQSRIMKTKDGFQQCYNAQAAVEVESMLVVANDLSNQGNDKGQLVPMVEKAKACHALSAIPDEG